MNLRPFLPIAALAFVSSAIAEPAGTPEQIAFFEKKIRPVLADKCYKCHSDKAEKVKGGLVLDTREGIRRGGDNGPAVVPGKLEDSLLIEAIRYQNPDFAMPPKKEGGKLPDGVIKDFEAWVQMGAPDAREGAAKVVTKYDTEEAKKWWSFQAPKKAAAPDVKNVAWPRGEIDRFILAGLEAKGLQPVADANKGTLIRRVYFDLTGLPPSLKEADDFIKDTSPDALATAVDRLLASPQFGERWGRHWLDVARYAESSGKDVNIAYPHAWRYRDYIIKAFNDGKPYDQFIREQIAGDLLSAKNDQQRAEQLVATGFLAIGVKSHNEQNARQFYLDLADDQIDTMSQAVLGMTISCARCHDHKFDPIPQRDYYALAGIFLSTETRFGTATGVQNRRAAELIELPKGAAAPVIAKTQAPEERARKERRLEELRKELADAFRSGRGQQGDGANQLRRLRSIQEIGMLEAELKAFDANGNARPLAMGAVDLPESGPGSFVGSMDRRRAAGNPMAFFRERQRARPPEFAMIGDARLYARGDVDKPGDKVPRGFPSALSAKEEGDIRIGSGRLELAEWLTSGANPLTARVFVNRAWHWLFGRGLVESCDNFGTTGMKPSNHALLDTIAVKFVESGWNVKALIREIVLSRAYALSSNYEEKDFHADPENALVWRANKRRLDAECVRDAMLFASGDLQYTPPVGSAIALQGDGPIGQPRFRGMSDETLLNAGATNKVRSIYLPLARDLTPDALAVFDSADSSLVTGTRETTNVPSQALYLLNSSFAADQAKKLSKRITDAYPNDANAGTAARLDERLRYAYWIVFNRPPDAAEKQAAITFFTKFPNSWAKGDKAIPGLKDAEAIDAAWTSFCRALFAAGEFRYLN
jgi:Protein of unknown function (DUF1549)/Protein of unknown function (DUF1553)/Planctomycete cytochrome C